MEIGFIGLGVMGTPMAGHLHRAGHRLRVHDLDPGKAEAWAKGLDAKDAIASDLTQIALHSEVVITMLPDGHAVHEVVCGEAGLLPQLRAGSLLLDCSSSQPWLTQSTAQALAAAGVAMVDAPVSGAQWGAEAAELVFMVGAEAHDLARVRPLLEVMGQSVHHLGPLGAGHTMKCINNLITAITLTATAEGLVMGKAAGLDPAAMVRVMNESTSGSWVSRTHIEQRILSRRFDDPFQLGLMLKDMGIANGLARDHRVVAPLAALAQQLWQAADHRAGSGASVSEIVRWVEQQSGVDITPGARS
jgi:3-hydroxyisobutyrate dehydrogenase-like beta-hydroxyacid dehydrogenase